MMAKETMQVLSIIFLTAWCFIWVTIAASSAVSSEEECNRYVSTARGSKTVLQFRPAPAQADFTLLDDSGEQYWQFSASVGSGLVGSIYALRGGSDKDGKVLHITSLIVDYNTDPSTETKFLIFSDMVFWPDCQPEQ